jgi:hypothetical protein
MSLFEIYLRLDENYNIHAGRLLVLLRAFAGSSGKDTIDGLTKLAKLDFLLRYPVYLERALEAKGASPSAVKIEDHERSSVESIMVRYKYGPWDPRHRQIVNLLVARGLASVETEGRTVKIGLTPAGVTIANTLSASDAYRDITSRAQVLKRKFDMTATTLMKFVYKTFPEIETMRLGEAIY